jgi:hypothetical protein
MIMPDYGLWQQIGTMDKLDEYKLTMPMIDEEWIMEKWMIHYGQLWRCQWNTEWWLNLPVSLRNYVFDLLDSVSEATLFFSWFLGSTGYKTILHVHCHVYILYIFYHTRLVGKCTHVLCDCVVFSFSPVSCSRNPGCSTAPQLGVECSSVLCWLQCFEDCQGDRMGQNLRPGNGGTVNGTPVGVTVLFMSQCSYGRIWKLDMPPK